MVGEGGQAAGGAWEERMAMGVGSSEPEAACGGSSLDRAHRACGRCL